MAGRQGRGCWEAVLRGVAAGPAAAAWKGRHCEESGLTPPAEAQQLLKQAGRRRRAVSLTWQLDCWVEGADVSVAQLQLRHQRLLAQSGV